MTMKPFEYRSVDFSTYSLFECLGEFSRDELMRLERIIAVDIDPPTGWDGLP